jgi:hypothetical protein
MPRPYLNRILRETNELFERTKSPYYYLRDKRSALRYAISYLRLSSEEKDALYYRTCHLCENDEVDIMESYKTKCPCIWFRIVPYYAFDDDKYEEYLIADGKKARKKYRIEEKHLRRILFQRR